MLEMFNSLFLGLIQVFNWSTFSLMIIGIAVGFVVGILPGLGGPTAMALMLPFIFKMSAVEAFAFLLGMTAVTATTGDITSVLFGVPGEPTTASTIVDGHVDGAKRRGGPRFGSGIDELSNRSDFRWRRAGCSHSGCTSDSSFVRFS